MAQMVKILAVFRHANYGVVEWESNGNSRYVACWCPCVAEDDTSEFIRPGLKDVGRTMLTYWGQGHYFQKKEDAMQYAIEEEREAIETKIDILKQESESLGKQLNDYLQEDQ